MSVAKVGSHNTSRSSGFIVSGRLSAAKALAANNCVSSSSSAKFAKAVLTMNSTNTFGAAPRYTGQKKKERNNSYHIP